MNLFVGYFMSLSEMNRILMLVALGFIFLLLILTLRSSSRKRSLEKAWEEKELTRKEMESLSRMLEKGKKNSQPVMHSFCEEIATLQDLMDSAKGRIPVECHVEVMDFQIPENTMRPLMEEFMRSSREIHLFTRRIATGFMLTLLEMNGGKQAMQHAMETAENLSLHDTMEADRADGTQALQGIKERMEAAQGIYFMINPMTDGRSVTVMIPDQYAISHDISNEIEETQTSQKKASRGLSYRIGNCCMES